MESRDSSNHACYLVEDVPKAIEVLGASTGIEFGYPLTFSCLAQTDTNETDIELTISYSLDHRVELLQAALESPFPASLGFGFHHAGRRASEDIDAAVEKQLALGAEVESRLIVDGDVMAVFFKPNARRPMRFELLSPSAPGLPY
jgi:hypothetical protein